jgi:hypothetical protein
MDKAIAMPQPDPLEAVHDLIRHAMLRKSPIQAVYKHHRRMLCPHVLGTNKDGRWQILCYQFGGESSRGLQRGDSPANWRCIPLSGLSAVELLDLPWRSGAKHSNIQTCIEYIELDAEDPSKNGTRRVSAKASGAQ